MTNRPSQSESRPLQPRFVHARLSRRTAIQAGSISLLGLGMNHVAGLRALADETSSSKPTSHKAVIDIFLSGGLAQHDSFDPKPDAPDTIRGEFAPIATRTPGVQVNLGNNESWDTHEKAFPNLRDFLLPPTDRAVSALIDDLDPQRPENMAATIYQALGLPRTIVWKDRLDRPHHVYHGDPIRGLT